MTRLKTVRLWRGSPDDLEGSFAKFIEKLQEFMATIPEEYKAIAQIDFTNGYDGDPMEMDIYYYRQMTEQEIQEEAERATKAKFAQKQHEINTAIATLHRNGIEVKVEQSAQP